MADYHDRLLFLGTGAADWGEAPEHGTHRRFSAMLAYGDTLIDCPAKTIGALAEYGVALSDIAYLLITHAHDDHLSIDAVRTIRDARMAAGGAFEIYAHPAVAAELRAAGIEACETIHAQRVACGELRVTALAANHIWEGNGEGGLHYLIESGQSVFLYATDGAWMRSESWQLLTQHKLDALIIDATIGDGHAGDYRIFVHNSLPMIRIMVETMQSSGVLKEKAKVFLTHMARTLHPGQKALEASLEPPFIPAYDGMTVRL